jgi:hypothetical protein
MIIRAISARSPYQRGGLKFDAAAAAWGDGRAMVEIDQVTLRRIGEDGLRALVQDPNIELIMPPEVGRHAPPLSAAAPHKAAAPAKPAAKPRSRARGK